MPFALYDKHKIYEAIFLEGYTMHQRQALSDYALRHFYYG